MQGCPKDPGVIPRVVKVSLSNRTIPEGETPLLMTFPVRIPQHIFMKKSRLKKSSLKISFSYVEILVEEVYDLLVTRRPGDVSFYLL